MNSGSARRDLLRRFGWALLALTLGLGVWMGLAKREAMKSPGRAPAPSGGGELGELGELGSGGAEPNGVEEHPPEARGMVWYGPRGQQIHLNTDISVDYGAPVNQSRVERGVTIEPSFPWKISWLSASRFSLTPASPLQMGTDYTVTVNGQRADGEELDELRWVFRTEVPAPSQVTPGGGANLILTFDDGPSRRAQAEPLLELLAQSGVKAIFFPVAKNLEQLPNWAAGVMKRGHLVCNHSYSHPDLSSASLSEQELRREIEAGAGHGRCGLLRPPMRAFNPRVEVMARELGYEIFLWDIDTRDWENIHAEEIVNRVMRAVQPGAVILFHLQAKHTLRALRRLLPRLVQAGYVLSWDPRDVEHEGLFQPGLKQTWLVGPGKARARWLEHFAEPSGAVGAGLEGVALWPYWAPTERGTNAAIGSASP